MSLTFQSIRSGVLKADIRTKCIVLAASLTAVLPLEIHHLLAMILGAAGYMFLQQLEPTVRRRERVQVKKKQPRPSGEKDFYPVKEVKKPSVVPVQAPKFQATGWDAEVVELLEKITLTDDVRGEVECITQKVRELLAPVLPGVKLMGFAVANPHGATAFGVAVPDVEIVVTSAQAAGAEAKFQKSLIRTCTDRLVSGGFKFRRSAFRGSEPKVTLISPAKDGQAIPFNLAVNALTPARAQRIFQACESCSPHAAHLLLLVRRWAKDRGVSHAAKGHLSPYCWMLLAVYYLQDAGALPAGLSFLQAKDLSMAPSSQLLKGFMNFYAQFSWKQVVSLRGSKMAGRMVEGQACPCIEDPFEQGTDLAVGMHSQSLLRLQEEMRRGRELCASASLVELLEPWVPPEE